MAFLYTPWKHCYATALCTTALYTTDADYATITHARTSLPHACNHERSIYGRNAENEPVSRIKMADYSELVSMGTL